MGPAHRCWGERELQYDRQKDFKERATYLCHVMYKTLDRLSIDFLLPWMLMDAVHVNRIFPENQVFSADKVISSKCQLSPELDQYKTKFYEKSSNFKSNLKNRYRIIQIECDNILMLLITF